MAVQSRGNTTCHYSLEEKLSAMIKPADMHEARLRPVQAFGVPASVWIITAASGIDVNAGLAGCLTAHRLATRHLWQQQT